MLIVELALIGVCAAAAFCLPLAAIVLLCKGGR
jgi:hypothetical protein